MTRPHVLISGASIAGPALAFWLTRYGWDTSVVERAATFRPGGQNIDIRGAAREVIRRAGLEKAVRQATTGEIGTRFIGDDGSTVAEFRAKKSDTVGPTAELEILRGDLARILVDAGGDRTEYLYGDRIRALVDTGSGVVVSFVYSLAAVLIPRRRHSRRRLGQISVSIITKSFGFTMSSVRRIVNVQSSGR